MAILGMYRLACSEDASEKQESISILDRIAQSTPERQITLPLIGGLTESEARDRIRRSGHQGRITTLVTSKTVNCPNQAKSANIGRVCASKPNYLDSNERLVDINADITLLIQGDRDLDEPYGIPPRVLGISRDSAIKTLIQQGFSNLSFRFVEDSGCPSQTVCRLRNAAFGQMPDGTWEGMNAVRRTEELTLYVGTSYPKGNNKLDAAMISIVGYAIDAALEKLDEFGV